MSMEGKGETKIAITALRENRELRAMNNKLAWIVRDAGLAVPEDYVDTSAAELVSMRKQLEEQKALVEYWKRKAIK